MAPDFSYLSSPERDDAAVDAIISQAVELSALEQIAALNTSHLSDAVLSTNLETRFQKLKSFPGADPKPRTAPPRLNSDEDRRPRSLNRCGSRRALAPDSKPMENIKPASDEGEIPRPAKPKGVRELDSELRSGFGSPNGAVGETEISPPSKPKDARDLDSKLRSGFGSSPSISPGPWRDSPSPPRLVCCFGCSPKRVSRKKGSGDVIAGFGLDAGDWGKNDKLLSDLSTFSMKEQRRRMKKALKEEEKVSREAEKVVKWVKQASARFDVSTIDEVVSDEEKIK